MSGPKRPKLNVRGLTRKVIKKTIQKAAQESQRIDTSQLNLANVAKLLDKK